MILDRWLAPLLAVGLAFGAQAAEPVPGLYDRPVLALDPGMHTARIVRADVDRDGRFAVTASEDKTVRVWSLADGALERTIWLPAGPGNVGKAFAVAISPDGATIAPGGNDLAVVMFSGHGVVLGEGETAEFYLLPHGADVASESRIRGSGISGTELRGQIAALAGFGRVLVLLDTCSSGAAMADGRPLGAGRERVLSLAGKNVTVLASSAATEVSRERAEWRNGAFTEALLEALGQDGDRDGNGMVSVAELTDYVARRLPVLSGDTQAPSNEARFDGDLFASGF
jgi:uncharacterized caspase-like protein